MIDVKKTSENGLMKHALWKKIQFKEFIKVFFFILKVTFLSFGGGNALFPIIKNYAVDKYQWLSQKEFDQVIIVTNLLPGPSVIEALSYVAMKQLGVIVGVLITIIAVFPHIGLALGLYLAAKQLPINYLLIISVAVLAVIIGMLIGFTYRYIKIAYKQMGLPLLLALLIFTISFNLFVPAPYNIGAIPIVLTIVIVILYQFIKAKNKIKKKK